MYIFVCVQSCYVDPVMMMYRGNSKVDEIVQRIIAHEEPVHSCDRDPLSTIDAQILFDRLLQPILRINSYQTENRMIYGMSVSLCLCEWTLCMCKCMYE